MVFSILNGATIEGMISSVMERMCSLKTNMLPMGSRKPFKDASSSTMKHTLFINSSPLKEVLSSTLKHTLSFNSTPLLRHAIPYN